MEGDDERRGDVGARVVGRALGARAEARGGARRAALGHVGEERPQPRRGCPRRPVEEHRVDGAAPERAAAHAERAEVRGELVADEERRVVPRGREPGQDKRDSTSLQRECSARARSGKSIHASRPLREMIARPKISRNEWKTAETVSYTHLTLPTIYSV